MAPLDLLNVGLPQTFNLYKTQYLWSAIELYRYLSKLQAHSKYWRSMILRVGKEVD